MALNGNYIYIICNSKDSYIYKINKINFNLEGVIKIDRTYSKIISVSENRLLLLDNHNNYLNLIDQNFTILNSLNFENNLLFSFATKSSKLNTVLFAGTFNNIDLLIREIYIENDQFVFKSNYEIPHF